jgi:hypothetical protein
MKKIFTLLLIVSAMAVNAQSIKLFYNGNPLNNNDTVYQNIGGADELNTFFGYQNLTSELIDFRVKKEVIFKDEDADLSFCIGECYIGTYSQPITLDGNQMVADNESMALHLIYSGSTAPALAKYTLMLTDDESDQVSVYVYYNGGTGIKDVDMVKTLRAYPNPAVSTVNVEYVTPAGGGNLVIKNLAGKEVYHVAVSGAGCRQIDISSLCPGVYLYGVEANGRMVCTKKLLVK